MYKIFKENYINTHISYKKYNFFYEEKNTICLGYYPKQDTSGSCDFLL